MKIIYDFKQSLIWEQIDYFTAMGYPDPYKAYLQLMAKKGDQVITSELTADTDHVVYAISISDECLFNGKPEIQEFHTNDVIFSENVITLDIVNVETRIIDVKVTTTNDDPYVLLR